MLALRCAVVALGFGLRLDAALEPDREPGRATRSSPTRATTRSPTAIAACLYEDGRYGTPEMQHPTDWSPGAPLFYAGVYYLTGGVHPDLARVGGRAARRR